MITRRNLLKTIGAGFPMTAFAQMSANPAVAEAAALRAARQARHLSVPERRPVAGGHVRPQADAAEVPRQADADAESEDRAQDRQPARLAVHVQEVRPERHRGQRDFPRDRHGDRRSLRHPLHAHRAAESRALAAADELRPAPARPSVDGLVAHLRARHGESESAGLRGAVPRPAGARPHPVDLGLPARRLPGHLHAEQRERARQADPESPQHALLDAGTDRAARPAAEAEPPPHGARRRRPAARSRHPVDGDRLPHADRGARRVRHHARAGEGPRAHTATAISRAAA